MPHLLLPIVLRIIQSMATRNNLGDRTQPWRTLLLTLNQSVSFFMDNTAREIVVETFDDADHLLWAPIGLGRILHKVSLWMLSKAFSRSMKLMCTLVFHSIHCPMIFRNNYSNGILWTVLACKGWISLEHEHRHMHKYKHKWKQPRHKNKHKQKHKNEPIYFSCAVFTSNMLDINISINTRTTHSFVFVVLMLVLALML